MLRPLQTWVVALALALPAVGQRASPASDLAASVAKDLPALIDTYKYLHRNPELSRKEDKTAAFLAEELRKLGYVVTEHVGTYAEGAQADGVVAVMRNGSGPRLLIRTDMDALPMEEKTNLDFASTVSSVNEQGQRVKVMHSCGHDLHMTVLLGTAREMADRRSQWHGTLMLIGQPSEEIGQGAKAMLADHLYDRFGQPDDVLSEHDSPDVPAGSVAIKGGPLLAGVASIDMTISGLGSHGSAPQQGKDPILLASEFVMLAQTIVSRQIDPQQPAVLTVGMFHGGTKNNIIPDEVKLGLSIRSFSQAVLDQMIADVRRTANGLAEAYGIPEDRMPKITLVNMGPATVNDNDLAERLRQAAVRILGTDRVEQAKPIMASEDAGLFTSNGKIPGVMFWLGAADPEKLAESRRSGVPLPGLHSPFFVPVYSPAIKTGVTAMTGMAIDLLN